MEDPGEGGIETDWKGRKCCRQKEFPAFRQLVKTVAVWYELFGG